MVIQVRPSVHKSYRFLFEVTMSSDKFDKGGCYKETYSIQFLPRKDARTVKVCIEFTDT